MNLPFLVGIAFALFATSQSRPVTATVEVADLSTSFVEDPCGGVAAGVRHVLTLRGVRRLDVLVLGTGDAATALEPVVLVPWKRWESSGALFERPGRSQAAREAWVGSIDRVCRTAARKTTLSPIYTAVRRGAESLRAHCAELERRGERCDRQLMYVHSDMRENANEKISRRLAAGTVRAPPVDLPRIAASDLELHICGVSQTHAGRGDTVVTPDALSVVWSEVLGSPNLQFEAACPVDDRNNLVHDTHASENRR